MKFLVRTAVLVALALAFQLLNFPQMVTGPAVNAVLYVAALYIHPVSGVLVGLITPWVAFSVGIMKLAPAVPVIMLGNATLSLLAGYIGRKSRYFGMILGALGKFSVMTLGMKYLLSIGQKIPSPVYASLTATQLVTALLGALVAALVLGVLFRVEKSRHGGSSA